MTLKEYINNSPLSFKGTTSLNLCNRKLTDIYGIEDLSDLEYLDISHNSITDIEPLLKLYKLKNIYLDFNNIENIHLIQDFKSNITTLYTDELNDLSLIKKFSLEKFKFLTDDILLIKNINILLDMVKLRYLKVNSKIYEYPNLEKYMNFIKKQRRKKIIEDLII